jgi:hypothetical protein
MIARRDREDLTALLSSLDELDDELTIYASPDLTETSRAIAVKEPEDGSVPPEAADLTYLLEVRLAKEVLRVWSDWRQGAAPTPEDRVEAIVHYARHDAYLPLDAGSAGDPTQP